MATTEILIVVRHKKKFYRNMRKISWWENEQGVPQEIEYQVSKGVRDICRDIKFNDTHQRSLLAMG